MQPGPPSPIRIATPPVLSGAAEYVHTDQREPDARDDRQDRDDTQWQRKAPSQLPERLGETHPDAAADRHDGKQKHAAGSFANRLPPNWRDDVESGLLRALIH
jgi:hypothetical protein